MEYDLSAVTWKIILSVKSLGNARPNERMYENTNRITTQIMIVRCDNSAGDNNNINITNEWINENIEYSTHQLLFEYMKVPSYSAYRLPLERTPFTQMDTIRYSENREIELQWKRNLSVIFYLITTGRTVTGRGYSGKRNALTTSSGYLVSFSR